MSIVHFFVFLDHNCHYSTFFDASTLTLFIPWYPADTNISIPPLLSILIPQPTHKLKHQLTKHQTDRKQNHSSESTSSGTNHQITHDKTMPSIKALFSASAIAFFATTDAHMILAQPPPYGSPNSSPLDPSGSNFPCKATSNTGGPVTSMAVGAPLEMSFNGSAVHGGGSCQISLTKDTPATKDSKWMVIHSIMSGCPARDAGGNLPESPTGGPGKDPNAYKYTIPQGIEAGAYTLAWTWFNRIGNREMYMNCASIKVTAGPSKRDTSFNETEYSIPELSERAAPKFPDMFKANIPASDCTTPESHDVQFPDPGSSVDKASASPSFAPPTGPKCGAAGTSASTGSSSGSSSGSSGSSSGASGAAPNAASSASSPAASGASGAVPSVASPASSPAASAAAPDSQAAPAVAGGASAIPSVAAGGASAAPPSSAPVQSVAAPVVAAPIASSAPSAAANSSGSSASGSTAPATGSSTGTCTQPGQSICSPDGRQIGTCTPSNTVTWIPVAAGTKCAGGYMVAAKRSAKFSSGYIRRGLALGPW